VLAIQYSHIIPVIHLCKKLW